jgi:acyl carrier protein
MDNQQILEKLKTIVISIKSNALINENSALIGDSIIDSLEFMNYLTKVEETFGINITDSEINSQKLGILFNMVAHISTKINKE